MISQITQTNNFKLTNKHLHTAKAICDRFAKRWKVPSEDLLSYAYEALVKCSQKYDSTQGEFEAYAFVWMKRNMSRYWRDHSQVPRAVQEMYFRANKLKKQNLDDSEICNFLSINQLQLRNCRLLMKHYYYYQGIESHFDERKIQFQHKEYIPDFNLLLSCFKLRPKLSEEIKAEIIRLRYEEFYTLKMIAKKLQLNFQVVKYFLQKNSAGGNASSHGACSTPASANYPRIKGRRKIY